MITYKSVHGDECWLGSEELTKGNLRPAFLYLEQPALLTGQKGWVDASANSSPGS